MTREPGVEELSFGGGRESRFIGWAAGHRGALRLVMGAVVLVAGLGAGGWYLHERSLLPSPPPGGPFPVLDRLMVVPCLEEDVGCEVASMDRVTALVAGLREVTSTRVVPVDELNRRDQAASLVPATPRSTIRTPEIEATIRRPEDAAAVERTLTGRPGISLVTPRLDSFWKGKADLGIYLCGPRHQFARCRYAAATESQRDAVVARLREQDGVTEVFLQDRTFALRLASHYDPAERRRAEDMPESLFVRVTDPVKARAAGRAVLGMPGVGWANLVT
ncbi:MAG: hypothetical protein HOY71_33350 [Nonomuraea sp.]|nr:hypothetical protein [Nonomuraea sp.]